ncbi:MAG: MBL fold metallo-hydrolase, partial [Clostridia bacterium]|nr:MBL fold metallo-hydrolase [Clostridia bacterium]
MHTITEVRPDIIRITIPFEDIYTTVFLIRTAEGFLLFDTATYDSDIDRYILPAMQQVGVTPDMLKYVFISHSHRDHAGGLARLMQFCPQVCILSHSTSLRESFSQYINHDIQEDEPVLKDLHMILIPGHAPDCAAVLDKRSNTLITGDCLQVYGIYGSGNWGTNITMQSAHRKAIRRLRT